MCDVWCLHQIRCHHWSEHIKNYLIVLTTLWNGNYYFSYRKGIWGPQGLCNLSKILHTVSSWAAYYTQSVSRTCKPYQNAKLWNHPPNDFGYRLHTICIIFKLIFFLFSGSVRGLRKRFSDEETEIQRELSWKQSQARGLFLCSHWLPGLRELLCLDSTTLWSVLVMGSPGCSTLCFRDHLPLCPTHQVKQSSSNKAYSQQPALSGKLPPIHSYCRLQAYQMDIYWVLLQKTLY